MINEFRRAYSFLSNFFSAPQTTPYNDGNTLIYPTNEHFFQAHKTTNWNEHVIIANATTPAEAKQMGRHVAIREDWKDIRIGVMKIGIEAKFNQSPILRQMLINTFPHDLCEGNYWHDDVWGNCSCARCLHSPGQNLLGRLLMFYRSTLIKKKGGIL